MWSRVGRGFARIPRTYPIAIRVALSTRGCFQLLRSRLRCKRFTAVRLGLFGGRRRGDRLWFTYDNCLGQFSRPRKPFRGRSGWKAQFRERFQWFWALPRWGRTCFHHLTGIRQTFPERDGCLPANVFGGHHACENPSTKHRKQSFHGLSPVTQSPPKACFGSKAPLSAEVPENA